MWQILTEKFFEIISTLFIFEVIDQYEGGIRLRWGRYSKTLGVGVAWKVPIMHKILSTSVVTTTENLGSQTLTTHDQQLIVVSSVVKYYIRNVRPYLLAVTDSTDVLSDVTMGTIRKIISDHTFEDLLLNKDIERDIAREVRKEVNQYGFAIKSITLTDFGKIKTIRLIQDIGADE